MTQESGVELTQPIQVALDELKSLIVARFPESTFAIRERFDPPGISLVATVDIEDTDEVVAVIGDRLVELQVEEGLPIYVVPLQPIERVMAELRRQQAHTRAFLMPTG